MNSAWLYTLFAAAAGEILPDLKHQQAPGAVIVRGLLSIALMLLVKRLVPLRLDFRLYRARPRFVRTALA